MTKETYLYTADEAKEFLTKEGFVEDKEAIKSCYDLGIYRKKYSEGYSVTADIYDIAGLGEKKYTISFTGCYTAKANNKHVRTMFSGWQLKEVEAWLGDMFDKGIFGPDVD